ncbi:pilus assembly protein PilE [Cupriavidus plantarum]|uniref:pilus assembly protein PilE n=1 Tax=Cupriavidus plantarum TaxID=942865 RepID=UPI00339D668F
MTHAFAPCSGLGLAEVLVVVVIAAILAALALPAWQQHRARALRVEARAALAASMLALERHAAMHASFASAHDDAAPAGEWPQPVPPAPAVPHHWIAATTCGGLPLSQCVELRASPVRADPRCGTLVLRSHGAWLAIPAAHTTPVPLPIGC